MQHKENPAKAAALPDVFDLNEEEVAPFAQVFLLETDPQKKMAGVGAFLATASAAASKAAASGDFSGTCQLGDVTLPAVKCIHILQKIQEMMPTTWAATMTALGPLYGT